MKTGWTVTIHLETDPSRQLLTRRLMAVLNATTNLDDEATEPTSKAQADASTYLFKFRYPEDAGSKGLKINIAKEFRIRRAPFSDEHATTLSKVKR